MNLSSANSRHGSRPGWPAQVPTRRRMEVVPSVVGPLAVEVGVVSGDGPAAPVDGLVVVSDLQGQGGQSQAGIGGGVLSVIGEQPRIYRGKEAKPCRSAGTRCDAMQR
jgi:hypothetical protein